MSDDAPLEEMIAAPTAAARRAVLRRHPGLASEESVDRLKSQVEVRLRRSVKEARRAAAAATLLADVVGTPRARGAGLLARAFLDHGAGRYHRALDLYGEAEQRLRDGGLGEAADRVLLPRFDALARAGDEAGARRTAGRARRAYARRGLSRWVVMVDMNLGNVHHRAGRLSRALACYDRAAAGLDRLGARAGIAVNDLNRANVLTLIGRHGEAEDLFGRSADHFRKRGQRAAAAQAEYNRATLLLQQGEFSASLSALAEVEAAFRSEKDGRHLALLSLDRADILLRLGQVDAAAEEAGRARAGFRRLGLEAEAALAAGLAAVAAAERRPGSRRAIAKAVESLAAAGWRAWAASISLHEAGLALRAGEPDDAARIVRRALPALIRAELVDRIAIARLLRARADEARERLVRARRGYRQVLDDLAGIPLGWIAWRAHHGLARLAWRAGDRRETARRFRRAEGELEAVRDALAGDEVRGGLLEDAVPLYEDHVLFLLEGRGRNRSERAFELLERARARTLLTGLQGVPSAGRVAGHSAAEAILHELRGLQRRVAAALHGDAAPEDRRTRPPRIRRAELRRAERRARTLQIRLESLAGPGADPLRPLVPGADAIRQRLRRDESLVAYAALGDRLVAFLLRRGALSGPHDVADLAETERLVGDLRHDLSRRPAATRLRDATRISSERRLRDVRRLLIDPLEPDLSGGTLLIAPWGCLHGVPFHALLGRDGPLASSRPVVRVPSAGALWLARGGRRSRAGHSLVLGVPDPRVPRVEEECRRLADRLPRARVACGEDATADHLRREVSSARVLHVATHGLFQPDSPRLSAFLLADGWFGLADVYGLRLRADLVVLSSCDGGLGGALRGGESLGLARAFLLAGARAFLSALGPVRDDAAAFFMEAFYGALGRGVRVAEAHREAVLAARDRFDHPARWGLFVLDGDGSARLPGVST